MPKNLVLGHILANLTQIWPLFFQNLTSSVTRYHGQLSSCTKSEKANDLILRKLRDGRSYIECPKSNFIFSYLNPFQRIERCQ